MKLHEKLDAINAQTVRNVQRGHVETSGEAVSIALDRIDPGKATVRIDGPVKAYALSEYGLTVEVTGAGFINWEVQS